MRWRSERPTETHSMGKQTGPPELPRIDSRSAGSSQDGVATLWGMWAVVRARRPHDWASPGCEQRAVTWTACDSRGGDGGRAVTSGWCTIQLQCCPCGLTRVCPTVVAGTAERLDALPTALGSWCAKTVWALSRGSRVLTFGSGSVASAEVVSYEAIRAAWLCRLSAQGRACSFLSWPEAPTGWGAKAPSPCDRPTALWIGLGANRRGSWGSWRPLPVTGREPCFQTLCKRLQRHNQHTGGGAAKGSRGGWYRRRCVLRHPHRTPWVPNGTGQRCVGRYIVPEPYSLGCWQNGSWTRVRKQGVAHCRPMDLSNRRKRKLLFLWESGYRHWTSSGTERKWNKRFSSRPSTGGRSGAVLAVSWERANSNICRFPASGLLRWLPGRLGAWLERGGRPPARGSTRWPRCRFSLGRSSSGGCPRRRADWGLAPGAAVDGASRWGRTCWITSVCCCTAENCWAKPSTVSPNNPAWEMGASRKRALSTSFISTRLSQRWRSWTTMVDIAFPRDRTVTFIARRAKSVAVRSSCINPRSVLPSCTCLSALAWWTCRIAMACRAEAAWPTAL